MGSSLHQQHQDQEDWFVQPLGAREGAGQRAKQPAEPIEQTRLNLQEGVIARLRHRPLTQSLHPRIVIEFSVAALRHDVRAAFVQLAALPPDPLSFGMETAHVVAGADERIVRTLVGHALLDEAGAGRYRMHRALADWANQRHHAEVDAAQQRLATWHLDLVRAASADELAVWRRHSDNWQPLLQLWHL